MSKIDVAYNFIIFTTEPCASVGFLPYFFDKKLEPSLKERCNYEGETPICSAKDK